MASTIRHPATLVLLSLLLLLVTHARGNLLQEFLGYGAGSAEVRRGLPPRVGAGSSSRGKGNFVSNAASAMGRGHSQAGAFLGRTAQRRRSLQTPSTRLVAVGIPPRPVTFVEARARRFGRGLRHARRESLVAVGEPPRPITMLERRIGPEEGDAFQRDAALEPLCWGVGSECCYQEVRSGFLCVDDYGDRSIRCNPRVSFHVQCEDGSDPGLDRPPPPADRVKTADVIIRRFGAGSAEWARAGVPEHGTSDTYFTSEFPEMPRVAEAQTDEVRE